MKAIIEANSVVAEAMIEEETVAEDEEKAAVVDEARVLKTTSVAIRREQKAQPEDEEVAITTRDMISLKLNTTIAISLVTILGSVELLIIELKRRPITPNKRLKNVKLCY